MKNESIVLIPAHTYWEIFNDICSKTPEDEWWLVSRDKLDEKFLGLRHHKAPDEHQSVVPWEQAKVFTIINREKFLWIKLKYGI